ncbi:hypothetical protein OFB61_24610, partial [Escherichia coli]|nr:hypothetical protein [Escherichia coli]
WRTIRGEKLGKMETGKSKVGIRGKYVRRKSRKDGDRRGPEVVRSRSEIMSWTGSEMEMEMEMIDSKGGRTMACG